MSFGITPQGFVRKPIETILQDLKDKAKLPSFFGADVDLDPTGFLSLFIQFFAEELDANWKQLESIFYSQFVDTAEGVALDFVVALGGISRNPARKAQVELEFSGVNGSEIPVGTLVQTPTGIRFITIEAGIISSGSATVSAIALVAGSSGIVPPDLINEIATPLSGVEAVTNPAPSFDGAERETDPELRERYKSRGVSGGSSLVALRALLADLSDVSSVVGYENVESFEDVSGRPPHSMEFVIEGGTSIDIATIFESYKPGGIQLHGDVSFVKPDPFGNPQTYRWNVPEVVTIYCKVNITKNASWVTGSEAIVRENIIKVIGGVHTAGAIAKEHKGKGIGKPVLGWELVAAQLGSDEFDTIRVLGIDLVTVKVGLTAAPDPSLDSLLLTASQKPFCETDNIQVVVA